MNPRRVASLLRELADALEESEPATDCSCPPGAPEPMCMYCVGPYVCPGCHAVGGEPCAPGCIDDAIRRDAEDHE